MPEGQYPENWADISLSIRDRAKDQCECTGECALHRGNRCTETDLSDAKYAQGKVILTVAHLNHCKSDCRPENLKAMCNTCHLRYDLNLHARNMFENKRNQVTTIDMFEEENKS